MLAQVGCLLADSGSAAGPAFANDARRLATSISRPQDRARVLAVAGVALARAGRIPDAVGIINKIEIDLSQRSPEADIFSSLAVAAEGVTADQKTLLDSVLADAWRNESEIQRARVQRAIALSYANSLRAEDAVAAVRRVPGERSRALATSDVATALFFRGLKAPADELVRSMVQEVDDADTLAVIAGRLASANMSTEAAIVAARAMSLATKVVSFGDFNLLRHFRSQLSDLGEGFGISAEAVHGAFAGHFFGRVPEFQAADFARLALAQARVGNRAETQRAIEQAMEGIQRVQAAEDKSAVYLSLAQALASLRLYRRARLMADRCSSSSDHLLAYAEILRERALERRPGAAAFWRPAFAESFDEDCEPKAASLY